MASFISTIIFSFCCFSAFSMVSPEVRKYYKCYSIMTQTKPDSSSSILERVREGKVSGTEACMDVLNSANLNSEGLLLNHKKNLLGQQVLRSFQAFHNTWFQNHQTYMIDDSPIIYDIVELEEPALFLTQALFRKGWKFTDILKGNKSYHGIRQSTAEPAYLIGTSPSEKIKRKKIYDVPRGKGKEKKSWSPTHLPRGPLIGVAENPKKRDILPAHSHQLFFPTFYDEEVDIHESLGGGFMGTNSYLLFNNGRAHGERNDGQLIMFRSYSKYLIRDVMCRDLPVIKISDTKGMVRPNPMVNWNNSSSCMSCHATTDQMVGLLRNAELIINDISEQGSSHMKFHPVTVKTKPGYKLFDEFKDYYRSTPEGRFIYRDIKNEFFNMKLSSMDELGAAISKSYDLYACAASRYFYFFTGEEFNINELFQSPTTDKKKFLIFLADQLKKNKNQKEVIKLIFNSKFF